MRIAVVGAGGLGCPALLELAERGGHRLWVVDPDRVELSNLHRQILFREADVGRPKAEAAVAGLHRLLGPVDAEAMVQAFVPGASDWLDDVDHVLDATDDLETKFELHAACRTRGVDYTFASAVGWSGQVFTTRAQGPCLRCAFPQGLDASVRPRCETNGVLGPVLGRVAARQVELALAAEDHRLHAYDGRGDQWMCFRVAERPDCLGSNPTSSFEGIPVGYDDVEASELDLRGRRCPDTYIETRKRLERAPMGSLLWVRFDSDESARQVPMSAEAAGHRVRARLRSDRDHLILLERGA